MVVVLFIIGSIIGIIILISIYLYLRYAIPLRPKEEGFKYVYIENDGAVRELYDDEIEYMSETFDPRDSGRPYIKNRYKSLGFSNEISGMIARRRVPKEIIIKKVDQGQFNKTIYKVDKTGASGVFAKPENS